MSTNPGRPIAILLFAAATFACGRSGPHGPKDALRTSRSRAGFRIESYVTEPEIRSPVAMEFDEDGLVRVHCEGRAYSTRRHLI